LELLIAFLNVSLQDFRDRKRFTVLEARNNITGDFRRWQARVNLWENER